MWSALVNGLLRKKNVVEALSPRSAATQDAIAEIAPIPDPTPAGYAADDESVESEEEVKAGDEEEEEGSEASPPPLVVHKNKRPLLSPEAQRKFYWKYRPDVAASKADDGSAFRERKMPMVTINAELFWGRSSVPGCGNGVFTHVARKKGDIVEIGPTILDTDVQWKPRTQTAVHEFYTLEYNPTLNHWRQNVRNQHPRTKYSVLMLGYGSLYNHSDAPNCDVEFGACQTFIMKALRDIEAGEELFIDYGTDYWLDMAAPVKLGAKAVEKKEEDETPPKKTTAMKKKKKSPEANESSAKRRKVG